MSQYSTWPSTAGIIVLRVRMNSGRGDQVEGGDGQHSIITRQCLDNIHILQQNFPQVTTGTNRYMYRVINIDWYVTGNQTILPLITGLPVVHVNTCFSELPESALTMDNSTNSCLTTIVVPASLPSGIPFTPPLMKNIMGLYNSCSGYRDYLNRWHISYIYQLHLSV